MPIIVDLNESPLFVNDAKCVAERILKVRIIVWLVLSSLGLLPLASQATLTAGDIAIIAYNTNSSDDFAWVALVDIPANTTLNFTDSSWQDTGFRTTEHFNVSAGGPLTWLHTANVLAGTVIIYNGNTDSNPLTLSSWSIGTAGGAELDLSASGDQILVFTNTTTSPTFIYGSHFAHNSDWLTTGSNSTNTSNLPTGLTKGVSALYAGNFDNGYYNGITSGTKAELLAELGKSSNWTLNDTVPLAQSNWKTSFTIISLTNPTLNLSVSANTATETATTAIIVTVTASAAVSGDQTVTVGVSGTNITAGDYTLSSTTLTIPNGLTTGTVTFTIVDDAAVEGSETATIAISSPSSGINLGSTTSQDVTIADDDTTGFTLSETTASVNESGTTDTFTVVLDSQPTSNVEISVTSGDTGEATVSPATLTFTTGNWNTTQTVTITGVDDILSDSNQNTTVTLSIVDANSDDAFDALADKTVTVTTVDNDIPGISGAQIGGSISVTEGGASGSYPIALSTQPTGNVEITVTANAQTQVSMDGTTFSNGIVLTFTNGNWSTAQTVTVKAIDDTAIEGNHTATITHAITGTVNDANYPTTLTLGSVTINITDNDQAPSNSGGGSTSSGSVVLPSKMQIGVTISGTGSGKVVSQPSGIDCQKNSGTCQAIFPTNSKITLTATADENSEFSGFGGHTDCGDGSLLLFGNRQCTVFFIKKQATSPPDNSDNGSGDHHNMIPVYRLWSYTWESHFYTTNVDERERTLNHEQGWRDEDVAYYVYDANDHPENTHPVYRFWSYDWNAHFYTMNELEMERLVTYFPDQWRYEEVAYYAYKEGEQPVNSIPVYRFYSFEYQSHFYTTNENEKQELLTYPQTEWRYEGVAWYVSKY